MFDKSSNEKKKITCTFLFQIFIKIFGFKDVQNMAHWDNFHSYFILFN